MALRENTADRPGALRTLADDFFPLPETDLGYWKERGASIPGD
jgi:hypothetical protein